MAGRHTPEVELVLGPRTGFGIVLEPDFLLLKMSDIETFPVCVLYCQSWAALRMRGDYPQIPLGLWGTCRLTRVGVPLKYSLMQ